MATDARMQGKLAFDNNLAMSSCQYPIGSTLRTEWMEGWTTARNTKPGTDASPSQTTGDSSRVA